MINTTQFTTYMETLFETNTSEIFSFYSREDYELAISRYKTDREQTSQNETLKKMCKVRNIDMEELLMFPSKLKTIPTREEMTEKLLEAFHSLYRDVPTPAQYMARIVRRLAPEYADDPVRVAILKKFVLGGGFDWKTYSTKPIIAWAVNKMTVEEKALYETLPASEKLSMAVSKLDDSIFEECNPADQLPASRRLPLIKQNLDRLPEREIVISVGNPQEYQVLFDYLCKRFLVPDNPNTYHRLMELSGKSAEEISEDRQLLAEEILRAVYPEMTASAKVYFQKSKGIAHRAGSMLPVFRFLCKHFSIPEDYDVHRKILELGKRNFPDTIRPLAAEYMQQYHPEIPESCEAYADELERALWCIEKLACAKGLKRRDPLYAFLTGREFDTQIGTQKLAERLISNEDPDCAKDKSRYDQLLDNTLAFLNYLQCLNEKWIAFRNAVAEGCSRYGVPVDTISKMLDGLLKESDLWKKPDNSGFVDTIEVSFRQYISLVYYVSSDNCVKCALELFKNSLRDARRNANEEQKLFALCNELANGYFKSNGKTRRDLYHFAIIFKMTIKLQQSDIVDPKTDVVKNLFQDYYADNLIRYLSKDYENPAIVRGLEREPSGEGINFKNFAEVIYIYYLYRQDLELTPGERIDHAEAKIKACNRKGNDPDYKPDSNMLGETTPTENYQKRFLEQIVSVDEKRLVGCVLRNCHVNSAGSYIQISSNTNTANNLLQESMEEIELGSEYIAVPPLESDEPDVSKQLVEELIQDIKDSTHLQFAWNLKPLLTSKYKDESDFCRVINQLDARLTAEFNWISIRKMDLLANLLHILYLDSSESCAVKLKDLREKLQENDVTVTGDIVIQCADILRKLGFDIQRDTKTGESRFWLGTRIYDSPQLNEVISWIKSKYYFNTERVRRLLKPLLQEHGVFQQHVTRTTLIAAYVQEYIPLVEETCALETFPDLYIDFACSVNPILEKARFQPINAKNILDMYVVLSLYLYLLENGKN